MQKSNLKRSYHNAETTVVKYDFGECPVNALLDVIGGKWKPLILFYLLKGTQRFGDLRRAIPLVTQQSLTLQLRELEAAGIVRRYSYNTAQPRVEYELTELGHSLQPLMEMAIEWGKRYLAAQR
jgi:DNA-binding HxlR family transcriptional regulator